MSSSNPFDNKNIQSFTIRTFGEAIRERREQLEMTSRQLAKSIGISPVYLSEIERCSRPAPSGLISGIDYMSKLADALQLDASQKEVFNIMASLSRLNFLNMLTAYFSKNLNAFRFILQAVETNLEDSEWEKLYNETFSESEQG